jgi:4-hydroxy-2-oxoheptanedioate aldolase
MPGRIRTYHVPAIRYARRSGTLGSVHLEEKRRKVMGPNTLKRKLTAGEMALGIFVGFDAPFLLEIFGFTGFDFVVIDCEHGALDPHHVENLVRAAERSGATPIVRVPQNIPQILLRYLDVGPQGALIPWCQSAAEALAAAQATRYYPLGRRGLAGVRAAQYGVVEPLALYTQRANEELHLTVQVETAAAVEALPEMLQVPGVDAFFIGPNDLSQSLGYPGQPEEPAVQQVIDHALELIIGAGKTAGIMVKDAASARRYHERGATMISISVSGLVASASRTFLAAVRAR